MESSSLRSELSRLSARDAAERLVGCELIRVSKEGTVAGIIVETEAYDQSDIASHTYRGQTDRNRVMFGPAGLAYVYFTYGMHYCFNVVVGAEGVGAGVLIRALEPLDGIELMMHRRNTQDLYGLCNGPAKLCQAFAIDRQLNGHDLASLPLSLRLNQVLPGNQIVWTTRIGISKEKTNPLPWRACLKQSKFLSRPL